jgi:N-acetylglucosamine kinase-like BadF-type ATPase
MPGSTKSLVSENKIPPRVYLGLDGGGTQTRAVLVDETGLILGFGRAGSSNWNNLGLPSALNSLREAAEAAWTAAGLAFAPAEACFIGCAGLKSTGDCQWFANQVASTGIAVPGRLVAANDTEAALAGGLPGRSGIALIAGTGSFCLGRDETGRIARCGGWGWLMDDIGSGFWQGRAALQASVLAADGRGCDTSLLARILAHYKISDPDDLLSIIYAEALKPSEIAKLALEVSDCAQAGDEVAARILREGATGLAELVRRVATALNWSEGPEMAFFGGVARSGAPYQPLLEEAIRYAVPGIRISEPALPPVAGAALRALELGGVLITTDTITAVRTSCCRLGLKP